MKNNKELRSLKIELMKSAGITISESPADIGKTLYKKLNS